MSELDPYPFVTYLINCTIAPLGFFISLYCLGDLLIKFRAQKEYKIRKNMALSCVFVFGSGMFTFLVFFIEFYTFPLSNVFSHNFSSNQFCRYFTPFIFFSIALFHISIFTYFILRIQHSFHDTVFAYNPKCLSSFCICSVIILSFLSTLFVFQLKGIPYNLFGSKLDNENPTLCRNIHIHNNISEFWGWTLLTTFFCIVVIHLINLFLFVGRLYELVKMRHIIDPVAFNLRLGAKYSMSKIDSMGVFFPSIIDQSFCHPFFCLNKSVVCLKQSHPIHIIINHILYIKKKKEHI